jgi:hypothetical protein
MALKGTTKGIGRYLITGTQLVYKGMLCAIEGHAGFFIRILNVPGKGKMMY